MNYKKIRILGIFLIVGISIVLFLLLKTTHQKSSQKNIVENNLLTWGVGWKNHVSNYSGSELSLTVSNTSSLSLHASTLSEATQGIEIEVDEDTYTLSSPNLDKQKLTISLNPNTSHNIVIRHFCTYFYNPCKIEINSIEVDQKSNISSLNKNKKIMSVLGDSISTIYGAENYTTRLTKLLGYQLHNSSILGSTLSNVSGEKNGIDRYRKDLGDVKSNVVLLSLGSNDMAHNVDIYTFQADYKKILTDVRKWNPDSKLFIVGILPREDVPQEKIELYNKTLESMAEEGNAIFIDVSSFLTPKDFSDSVHPSQNIQAKLAEKFHEVIAPHIK